MISDTINILKVATQNYQKLKDDHSLREAFHEAGRALHIVEEALQTAETQLIARGLTETPTTVKNLIEGCNTKAKLSGSILEDVAQAPSLARFQRYKEAVQQHSKGKTSEALVLEMIEDVCNLADDDTLKAGMEHHVEKLRAVEDSLSNMESSVPSNTSTNTFNAFGRSNQYNATGGSQYNNTGSGKSLPNATFHAPVTFN